MENGPLQLTAAEARVLGALVEKEITTPEYYPLSLNALMSATNQRSSRDPVMQLDEDDLRQALHGLEAHGLAAAARTDSRVARYEHRLGEVFNFTRAEAALFCVLLLRGTQTPGELRTRTERLHRFDDLSDVLAGLGRLMERQPPLAVLLPRQAGAREARYALLITEQTAQTGAQIAAQSVHGTAAETDNEIHGHSPAGLRASDERLTRLEAVFAAAIAQLRDENHALRAQVEALNQKIDSIFGD